MYAIKLHDYLINIVPNGENVIYKLFNINVTI